MGPQDRDREADAKPTAPTDSSRSFNQPFSALFDTVLGLPSAIYNRGNEHGREWNRRYRGENDAHDNSPQRQESYEYRRHEKEEDRMVDDTPKDDWVSIIMEQMTIGQQEAQEMYEFWRKMEAGAHSEDAGSKRKEQTVKEFAEPEAFNKRPIFEAPEDTTKTEPVTWSKIFPAWQKEGNMQEEGLAHHQHVFGRVKDVEKAESPSLDIEDTIGKVFQGIHRAFGTAEKWTRQLQRDFERDLRLLEDEESTGVSCPFGRPMKDAFFRSMDPFMEHESPIIYLLWSGYSPIHLENEEGFDAHWRNRFEDLLRIQRGRKMLGQDEANEAAATPSMDWIGRVVPLLQEGERDTEAPPTAEFPIATSLKSSSDLASKECANRQPETEMDQYEQVLDKRLEIRSRNPELNERDHSESNILSTLTRTDRETHPDGSVTTRTFLKRRFADGRAESSETVETLPRSPGATGYLNDKRLALKGSEDGLDSQTGRNGWFWSS